MNKKLVYLIFVFSNLALAQNVGKVGINTVDPKSTLDVNVHSGYTNGDKAGISFPTLTGDQIEAMNIADLKPGTIVYSSSESTATTPDVNSVGLWYWTGDVVKKWEPFIGNNSAVTGDFWSLTGNIGTNPPTNFIGTRDAKSIVFKANNMVSGIIEPAYIQSLDFTQYFGNTVLGSLSLNPFENNNGMKYNSVLGAYSLYQFSSGEGNTALGAFSMDTQLLGSKNTAIGFGANVPDAEGSNQLSIGNSIYGLNISDGIVGNELIGVGTQDPKTALDVNGMAKAASVVSFSVSPDTQYHPTIANYASLGGTWDAPVYVQNGNTLGAFINRDFKSALDAQAAASSVYGGSDIYTTATENFTSTAKGSNMRFLTTANGTNLSQERVRIEHNGNVGIGTPEPKTALDVNGMAKAASVVSFSVSPDTQYHPVVANYASLGGTWDAPIYVQNGNTLGAFINRDFKSALDAQASSTQEYGGSEIYATATENFSLTSKGSNLKFLTTNNGTSISQERMRIENDGKIGIATTTPTSTLQVAGSLAANIRTLASGTVADNDYTVMITGSVSLPTASTSNTGRIYNIINGNTNSNTITGTFMINGGTFSNYTLNNSDLGRGIVIQSTGNAWLIISRY